MVPIGLQISQTAGMADDHTITLSVKERLRLEQLVADRNSPAKVVWRVNIVLATANGLAQMAVVRASGKSKACVRRWQGRFIAEGVDGLLRDKTRPPGTPPLTDALRLKVIAKTANERPANATHWSVRTMAKEMGTVILEKEARARDKLQAIKSGNYATESKH